MQDKKYSQFFDLNNIVKEVKGYLPSFDENLFIKAFEFAEEAHRGQMRKDGFTPYIVHPIEIVQILSKLHADQDILISALLHDVPEDTDRTMDDIRDNFGDSIAFLVDGITKLSKVHYKNDMPKRQVESLKKLFLHSARDLRVILIKLADRLHNMQTLGNISKPEKRLRIARETLEIYVPIANLLGIHAFKMELEDTCFQYLFPIEYEALKKKLDIYENQLEEVSIKFANSILKMIDMHNISATIHKKKRNIYSLYKKLCSDGKSIDDANYVLTFEVNVNEVSECYQILGIVHGAYTPKPGKFKDYIANPKSNGYQSLHTTVFGPGGLTVELQISTRQMRLNADYGITSHFFGNAAKENLFEDKRSMWVNKVVEIDRTNTHQDFDALLEDLKLDIFQDRIVVFTPTGDSVDMPQGASVLDFAYEIHTQVGNKAYKADINGMIFPLNHELKTGDVVKIITSDSSEPDISWLTFVQTNLAKNKIKAFLRHENRKDKIKKGRRILQKEFDIMEMGLFDQLPFKKVKKVLDEELNKQFRNEDQLFIAIAEGRLNSVRLAKVLKQNYKKLVGPLKRLSFKRIKGVESYKYNIKILAHNRLGLVPDVSKVFYKYVNDMLYFKGWSSRSRKTAIFQVQVIVDDMAKISRLFDELQQVEGVKYMYRTSHKGVLGFYLMSAVTLGIWFLHPTLLTILGNSRFSQNFPILDSYVVNISLLLLLGMVLYLTKMARKFFPLVRNPMLYMIISSSLGILAFGTLLVEIFYFDLQLSWLAILIEIALLYGYLGFHYNNFKRTYN